MTRAYLLAFLHGDGLSNYDVDGRAERHEAEVVLEDAAACGPEDLRAIVTCARWCGLEDLRAIVTYARSCGMQAGGLTRDCDLRAIVWAGGLTRDRDLRAIVRAGGLARDRQAELDATEPQRLGLFAVGKFRVDEFGVGTANKKFI